MDSELHNKLVNYEQEVPPGMWDRIVTVLDEYEQELPIAHKLGNYSEAPPAEVWSEIEKELKASEIHSLPQYMPHPLKWIKAAAVLIAVAPGVTFFIDKTALPKRVVHHTHLPVPVEYHDSVLRKLTKAHGSKIIPDTSQSLKTAVKK